MTKKILFCLILAAGFLTGAAENSEVPPELEQIREHLRTKGRNSPPWRWIFYGDSITHGAKHTHGWRSFPEIFAERLRWELRLRNDIVINSGISGHTTVQLLDKNQYHFRIKIFSPSVVIIMIGTNDVVRINDVKKYQDNLVELIKRIRGDKAIPVLMTCPLVWKSPGKKEYLMRYNGLPEYNAAIRETAKKYNVALVDNAARWRQIAPTPEKLAKLLGEDIHPGPLGHLEIAKEIFHVFDVFDEKSPSCNPIGKGPKDITHMLRQTKQPAK